MDLGLRGRTAPVLRGGGFSGSIADWSAGEGAQVATASTDRVLPGPLLSLARWSRTLTRKAGGEGEAAGPHAEQVAA